MQLVGTHERLRLLGNLAVFLCGQELGGDGRIENVEKDLAQRVAVCCVRLIAHNVAHERFGNACIDAVHAHMVAVVGRPAEGKLA